jgi:hypothetical protein
MRTNGFMLLNQTFFDKCRRDKEYGYLLFNLVWNASYMDTETLKKGCMYLNKAELAREINLSPVIINKKIKELATEDKKELEIDKIDNKTVIKIIDYEKYIHTKDSQKERYLLINQTFVDEICKDKKYFRLWISFIWFANTEGCLDYCSNRIVKVLGCAKNKFLKKRDELIEQGLISKFTKNKKTYIKIEHYKDYTTKETTEEENKEVYQNDTASDKKVTLTDKKSNSEAIKKVTLTDKKSNTDILKKDNNYNYNNNDDINTKENRQNFVVDVVEKKENLTTTPNFSNPTWETFSGTLPCGRQVYNLSGEYVCYMKTYIEGGYMKAVDLFLRRYWNSDYKKAFAKNSNITINQIDKWIIEFREKQSTFPKQETFLKSDIKGTGEKFYEEMFGYLINYLNKKAETYKKEIANEVPIRDNREQLRKAGINI